MYLLTCPSKKLRIHRGMEWFEFRNVNNAEDT